jgi:plasmid stability protein
MVEELLDDRKFIMVPKDLADQLKITAARLGTSVTDFAFEALTQALRIENLGSDLKDAVDLFQLVSMQRGAGSLSISRGNFKEIIEQLNEAQKTEQLNIWKESGRWYGAYLKAKLHLDDLFPFLQRDLEVSWNLDEVDIQQQDLMVVIRCTSFCMSKELTDLLVSFVMGLMDELGFSETDRDVLRGLAILKFLGKLD